MPIHLSDISVSTVLSLGNKGFRSPETVDHLKEIRTQTLILRGKNTLANTSEMISFFSPACAKRRGRKKEKGEKKISNMLVEYICIFSDI